MKRTLPLCRCRRKMSILDALEASNEPDGMTLPEISLAVQCNRANAHYALTEMLAAGLVERSASYWDGQPRWRITVVGKVRAVVARAAMH